MLGARTKQVNSYGKRSHRIVNDSDERRKRKPSVDVFEDLAPPTWAPVVAKMKRRGGSTASKSPKLRSHAAKRTVESPPRPLPKHIMAAAKAASPRTPLALLFSPNMPGLKSPSAKPMFVGKRAGITGTKVSPKPLTPRFQPFVERDIIVVDATGKTISKERRVSGPQQSKLKALDPSPEIISVTGSSDNSSPERLPRKQPAWMRKRRELIILSDEEEEHPEDHSEPDRPIISRPPKEVSGSLSSHSPPLPSSPSSPIPAKLVPPPIQKLPPSAPVSPPIRKRKAFQAQLRPGYHHVSSPAVPVRRVTPFRNGPKGHILGRREVVSLDSDDESASLDDLEDEFNRFAEHLSQSQSPNVQDDKPADAPQIPEYLKPLLQECDQTETGPLDFSSFIKTFPLDPLVKKDASNLTHTFTKIGEASFSEVFGIGGVVLKIIPLHNEATGGSETEDAAESPAPTDAQDVRKEIIVTRAMGEMCTGFIRLLKAYVVKGRYPETLLRLWDDYYNERGSEGIRPDVFALSQTYAIIVLPHGGPDLERYNFTHKSTVGWRQACSIFWQVAKTLSRAEELVSFEHRDLHWGQILVKDHKPAGQPLKTQALNVETKPPKNLFMDDPFHGVRVTLIDLGLARMDASDGSGGERVHWTPFEEEIFMGEGDYQFDVYRMMKRSNKGDWEGFKPITNVMWLHYLLVKLIKDKRLRAPAKSKNGQPILGDDRKPYDCLVDLECWLRGALGVPAKGRQRKSSNVATSGTLTCAGDVVSFGVKQGWIQVDH